MTASLSDRLATTIRTVADFPQPGILFKDITPVLADPVLMRDVIAEMSAPFAGQGITHVVGVESRGFLFGMPIALSLEVPFSPARKPGKLPWMTAREAYDLEYGSGVLEMHADALSAGAGRDSEFSRRARVLVVDDVLATGGTATATCRLIEQLGATVIGVSVLIELTALQGRQRLPERNVAAVLRV
ncbi:MAG: adenine phosphoribosyltransferase [Gemmatimonas sp.]|jgi:adenine phosphoribosyltransferase|uniref:adenine phosphoribosyltransferase n=1 Tax=Gemmatimonas sp. TaxID=1962908 RepID=UPI00391FC40C|nr:adenine phosphoribosyltransferase [Gemmatimonadota bacterium]